MNSLIGKLGEIERIFELDPEDCEWAFRWNWKLRSNSRGKIWYAVRTTRWRGIHLNVWLHREIMLRSGERPPSIKHKVDHKNGNTLDCRRENLRWASSSQNRVNRHGLIYRLEQQRAATSASQQAQSLPCSEAPTCAARGNTT